jgi:hypothetical protein
MTQAPTSLEATVQAYFLTWNETDPAQRQARLREVWTEAAHYVDPMFQADGLEQLDMLVAGLHENYAGHYFRQVGTVESHHDRARWSWDFLNAGGNLVMSGVDIAVLAPDGKLRDVTGFFSPPA